MDSMKIRVVLASISMVVLVKAEVEPKCKARSMLVYGYTDKKSEAEWHSINFCTGRDPNSHINDFCVVDEEDTSVPEVIIQHGVEYSPVKLNVKSAKSCHMKCACIRDSGCMQGEAQQVTCYPGLVWNKTSCQCEPRKPRTKACTGASKAGDKIPPPNANGHHSQQIPLNLFVFALVAELLLIVSVTFCVVNKTCRRRSQEFSRQVSQQMTETHRELSRQVSDRLRPIGVVSGPQSERLMGEGTEYGDYSGGGFTAR